jgi:hypothetical protein
MRDYHRQNILATNGAFYHVHKRGRPINCEICGKNKNFLLYHHWDDKQMEKGIWICNFCHVRVEIFEQGEQHWLIRKYVSLKKKIEANFCGG